METLIGPEGRIPVLEHDVKDLQEFKIQAKSTVKATATTWGIISAALGVGVHWMIDTFRGH
jgi:hypothetical protein